MDLYVCGSPVSPKKSLPQLRKAHLPDQTCHLPALQLLEVKPTEEADAFRFGGVWIFFSRQLFLETDDSPPVI